MDLEKYLSDNKIEIPEFATKIGTTNEAVYQYLKRVRRPRADIMSRIMEATNQQVTANDFYRLTPIQLHNNGITCDKGTA